jgi:acyl-CoA thioesterase-2
MLDTPMRPIFELEEVASSTYRLVRPPTLGSRVLGSGIIAASVLSTSTTVETGFRPAALHATFVRAGVPEIPLELRIEPVHEGRSVALRLVRVVQVEPDERVVASCTIRFHRSAEVSAPAWESSPAGPVVAPGIGRREDAVVATMELLDGFDIRAAVVPGSVERRVMHPYWAKATVPVPDRPGVDEALVALLSDLGVSNDAASPELSFRERRRAVTLDHALWWHSPPSVDEWLLVDAAPVRGASGRGIARGTISTEDGTVVASFVQEVTMPAVR